MSSIRQPLVFKQSMGFLGTGVVLIGGAIAAWCYWGHHLWTALKGPTEVTLEQIAEMPDPSQLPSTWVKVKIDPEKAALSKVVLEEERAGNKRIDEEYMMFQAGQKWMIASIEPDYRGNELSGQIWHNYVPLASKVRAMVEEDLKDLHQGNVYPWEFEADEDYKTQWIICSSIIGAVGLFGVMFCFGGIGGIFKSFRDPDPADYGLASFEELNAPVQSDSDDLMSRYLEMRNAGR